ncbi:hypothetical protein [Paraburkholderia sp. MM5482-R1]|uniref:hypothetical protein n=1 Tax=unclassified Paraburkholderia TaxID=2615204 RepID=UPI003D2058C9
MSTHVSEVFHRRAAELIERKLGVLGEWIKNSVPYQRDVNGTPIRDTDGELVLDYYPTSIFALAAWNGSQNCDYVREQFHLDFSTQSRGTFDNHPELKNKANKLLEALNVSGKVQSGQTKSTLIRQLLAERARLQVLCHIQETDVAGLLRQVENAEKKYIREHALRVRNEKEQEEQIQALLSKNAELASAQVQVTGLHHAGRTDRAKPKSKSTYRKGAC